MQRHVAALEERHELVSHLSERHEIMGFEGVQIDENRVQEFSNALNDFQKKSAIELENVKVRGVLRAPMMFARRDLTREDSYPSQRDGKRLEEEKNVEIFNLKSKEASRRQKKSAIVERIVSKEISQAVGDSITKSDIL